MSVITVVVMDYHSVTIIANRSRTRVTTITIMDNKGFTAFTKNSCLRLE